MTTDTAEPEVEKKTATLEEAPVRPRQMKAFDTFEELPADVQECARKLDHSTGQWQAWGAEQKAARKELQKLMKENNLKYVPAPEEDDKVFSLEISEPEEKVKKINRSKMRDSDDDEE